jgi:hypothetical protein
MTRIYVVVEEQSEETFVRELLVPHYARIGKYLTPIIVSTSPGYKGGVVSYAKVRPQLVRLCRQDAEAFVTTMFDLYALPADFPGKRDEGYPVHGSGSEKSTFIELCLAEEIGMVNLVPNLLVHEFEALLFTEPAKFSEWTDDEKVVGILQSVAALNATPEDINDGPLTAPSKRILKAMPSYQKTFHGPLIACEIGLDNIRLVCPHFDGWLTKIEALP